MKKFENILNDSEFSSEVIFFKTTSLITFGEKYLGECGIFLTKDYIIILNRKFSKTVNYAKIYDYETKNTIFGRKVFLNIPIEDMTIEMDFTFDKERQEFVSKLQKEMENKKIEIQSIIEKEEYEQEKKKTMPYEELKKLKELYDLEILTEKEYNLKRDEMLKDYL